MPPIPFPFIGPSYSSISKTFDAERSINLYPELSGVGAHPKSGIFLNKTPGLKKFVTLPTGPVRCLYAGDNRLFAIGGSKLYEIFANQTVGPALGDCGVATTPAQIITNAQSSPASGSELIVVSGAQVYLFDGSQPVGNQLTPVTAGVLGGYLDGYFIVQEPSSNRFFISGLLDGTSWDPNDFGSKIGGSDRLCAIFCDHEQLWLIGFRTTEVWYNSGAGNFPFSRIQGAFIEQGCIAPYTVGKLDNSLFWLGGDDRGAGIVWRMQGYTPIRVSNHAVEAAIQRYPVITDAIALTRQYLGHSFYEIHFPSANPDPISNVPAGACWVYDVATGMWHERLRWNPQSGKWAEHVCRFHAFGNFPDGPAGSSGQHFVGDYRNGNVYVESVDNLDNDGEPLRWLRSSPPLSDHLGWTYYEKLIIDMQTGGSTGYPGGMSAVNSPFLNQGSTPKGMLRISDDGGNTWDNGRIISLGRIGEYQSGRFRAEFRQLGRSVDRVIEFSGSDPIQIALVDAQLRGYPG